MKVFDLGDLVRVSGALKNAAGVAADPDALTVRYKRPGETLTILTYPADVSIVKDSVGGYHLDINASAPGVYRYRFASTGTGQAAAEGQFRVKPSALD